MGVFADWGECGRQPLQEQQSGGEHAGALPLHAAELSLWDGHAALLQGSQGPGTPVQRSQGCEFFPTASLHITSTSLACGTQKGGRCTR